MPEDRSPRRRPEKKTGKTAPPSLRAGRRRFLLVAAFSLFLAASLTFALLRLSWLNVQEVRVEGAQTLDSRALAEISALHGENIVTLPISKARKRLLDVPQVRSVSIERALPLAVVIKVEERAPYAYWSIGGRELVVDVEGVVLAAGVPSGAAPRVVEPDANRIVGPGDRVNQDALRLAGRIFEESPRFLGQGVRELEYRPPVGLTAVFDSSLRVTFGDERAYDYKVAVLSQLLEQLAANNAPRSVDLRFGERVTYEHR